MNRRPFLASTIALSGHLLLRRFAQGQAATPAPTPADQAATIRAAADQFLQTLAPDRRGRVVFPFPKGESPEAAKFARAGGKGGGPGGGADQRPPDAGQPAERRPPRETGGPGGGAGPGRGLGGPGGGFAGFIGEKFGLSVWSNFPVSDVIRPGLRMGELTTTERESVHTLLRVVLSPMGYRKVIDIMAADQVVADNGTPYAAGLDAYTLALFGRPDAAAPWMLQFGGHHLGLNVVFAGDQAVAAPLHTGILPARFAARGQVIRGLGRENDQAFDLLATFTPQQLRAASIDHRVSDLRCGPGHPTADIQPEGLRGADMTDAQRAMMLALAREWAGVLNDAHSAARLESLRASLPDTCFAWSGPTTHEPGQNGESYFRLHGPSLLIEHAPQDNQGGYKLHVHTVMRDLGNDYGKQLLAVGM